MLTVVSTIHIQRPLVEVFNLLADPAAKTALNAMVEPVSVEIENHERLQMGSICHYRLNFGETVLDYRGQVTAFEEGRLIESCTDSETPLTIRVETEPDDSGTWIRQTESFEATDEMLDNALPPSLLDKVLRQAYRVLLWSEERAAARIRDYREQQLQALLKQNLDRWLQDIKHHLEKNDEE